MKINSLNNTFASLRLRTKLIILFSLLLGAISAFMLVYFPGQLKKQALASISTKGQAIADLSAFSISPALYFGDLASIDEALGGVKSFEDLGYIIVTDAKGNLVVSHRGETAEKADYINTLSHNGISADGNYYKTMQPVFFREAEIGRIYLGLSLQNLNDKIAKTQTLMTEIIIVLFLFVLSLVFGIAAFITQPINQMVATVEKISGGDFNTRVNISTTDEVGHLASAFNAMVDKLVIVNANLEELNQTLENRVLERTESLRKEIEERVKIEESLRASEQLNRGIVENSPLGIMYLDEKGAMIYENPAMARMMGVPAGKESIVLGKRLFDLPSIQASGMLPSIRRLFNGVPIDGEEVEYKSAYGVTRFLEVYATPMQDKNGRVQGAIFMMVDISDFKQLEEQLRQAQKMEAIGTLAGGIAHDFNNILTGIIGYLDMALSEIEESNPIYDSLKKVSKNADRAAELTAQLLTYSRRRMERPGPVDINNCLNEALELLIHTINPAIEIKVVKEPVLEIIKADPGQMHQMLMNLIINACDAMPEGGILSIATENIQLSAEVVTKLSIIKPGEYIRISISDTGEGMPPELLERIFDPFFTTKEVGKGTGLGLSVVYGIIKGHKGYIDVVSSVGTGSVFVVYLPLLKSVIAEVSESQQPAAEEVPVERGYNETILIVDDEESVRELGVGILRKNGYRAITAEDGIEALEIFKLHYREIDAVVLDLWMPKKSGRQTLLEMLKFYPNVPIIISSGYDTSGAIQELLDLGARDFVPKPYKSHSLLQTLYHVLNAENS